jgi:hypothetical protein
MSFLIHISRRVRDSLCIWPLLLALGVAGLMMGTAQAQTTVAPSCPPGFTFSGGTCVSSAPAPTCPAGFVFNGTACVPGARTTAPAAGAGPWVFMIRRELGVTKATELDGAAICVETGQPSEAAVAAYFKSNGMAYEPVVSNSESEVVDGYDRNVCDVAVVADSVADTTANGLTPAGAHMILPEKIGGASVATAPAPRPTAAPTAPPVRRAAPAPAPRRAAPAPRRRAAPVAPSEPIALTLQRELKRIGCLTGRVDGIWGRGSRAALDRFAKQARLQLGREPSQVALDEALRTDAGYCKPVRTASRPTRGAAPRRGSGDFDIRDGYDLPGNDYRQLRGKVDYNTCLSTCENDSECLAFTYNTSARACFLKWGGDNWTRFGNAISGMRISGGIITELEEQEDGPDFGASDACFQECDRGQNSCIASLEPSWDGTNDHHFDVCNEEFDSCAAPCAFDRGDCFTFSDGSEVCP